MPIRLFSPVGSRVLTVCVFGVATGLVGVDVTTSSPIVLYEITDLSAVNDLSVGRDLNVVTIANEEDVSVDLTAPSGGPLTNAQLRKVSI